MTRCNDHWLVDVRGAEERRRTGGAKGEGKSVDAKVMGKTIIRGKYFSLGGWIAVREWWMCGCASPDLLGQRRWW